MKSNPTNKPEKKRNEKPHFFISTVELCIYAMLGTVMFVSKLLMEALPNIHLLGMFTILFTVVYQKKALIPLYVYVLLNGIFSGFSLWWIPYLYIFTLLWGVVMLLPKQKPKAALFVYPLVCGLHGLLFGTLYAPTQALMFGFTFEQTIAWIVAGLPFDLIHAAGNLVAGFLVLPLSRLLRRLNRQLGINP